MLIKSADDQTKDIRELKSLLKLPNLTSSQKSAIQDQIDNLEKGAWGEHRAAYFLDFHFAGSTNCIVLHDLRLVLSDNRTAQIDHLLIDRTLCIYVLESKNWNQLTVDETGACTTWAGRVIGVESPLEQCRRHAEVLKLALRGHTELKELAPRFEIIPRVLVAPKCNLRAPHHRDWYLKADYFYETRQKEIDQVTTIKALIEITRLVSSEKLKKLGHLLASLHHPSQINWQTKFGLPSANKVVSSIEGLAEFVPKWGEDWFVLNGKPTEETKKTIRAAGYRAKQENGEWVWRLKS